MTLDLLLVGHYFLKKEVTGDYLHWTDEAIPVGWVFLVNQITLEHRIG